MFSGFNGDFRRRPIVNIRGASKKESRQELLQRAAEDRSKREHARASALSAVRLQSLARSFLGRRRQQRLWRQQFDALRAGAGAEPATSAAASAQEEALLRDLIRRMMLFFDVEKDRDRMSWLCQRCLRHHRLLLQLVHATGSGSGFAMPWLYRVARLLHQCLLFLQTAAADENVNAALRLVDIFTSIDPTNPAPTRFLLSYVVVARHAYFPALRVLCDARVPPLLDGETTAPPTPMAETLLELVWKPVKMLAAGQEEGDDTHDQQKSDELCRLFSNLNRSFFCSAFSDQVRWFILPSLAERPFPFLQWVRALQQEQEQQKVQTSLWLLWTFLRLGKPEAIARMSEAEFLRYLSVLSSLAPLISQTLKFDRIDADDADEDEDDGMADDDDAGANDIHMADATEALYVRRCLDRLNSGDLVSCLVSATEKCRDASALHLLAHLCHHLLLTDRQALHKYRLLNTLAFKSGLIHRMWNMILETKQTASAGAQAAQATAAVRAVPLLTILSRGLRLSRADRDSILPLLTVFSSLFGYLLVTINDTEFYGDADGSASSASPVPLPPALQRSLSKNVWMPFTLAELVPMSLTLRDVALGLVELAFPESRPSVREDYQLAVRSVSLSSSHASSGPLPSVAASAAEDAADTTRIWSHLFRRTIDLLRQLYTRDTRRRFSPGDDHWICDRVQLPMDDQRRLAFGRLRRLRRHYRPFHGLRVFTREELEDHGPPMSTKEVRLATVLREMPYAFSFEQRALVFHNLVLRDKEEHQGDMANFLESAKIQAQIRRNFIYEDAFDKFSPQNEPNLRKRMRILLKNAAGLDEAGIDGGGLFREFLTELLKTAFDPNRGFFRQTRDQLLYPNPSVAKIEPNFVPHYHFIGRMLGKALYENLLVELPLASFFLSKLLGQQNVNVDIDHLSSLDPTLYKNLLSLKTYDGDVTELGLDFTIVSEEIGQTQVEDLKPNGADIAVTNENRIEYIHLVADFKLNRQIRMQCNAFRQGLSDVINLDWLHMFSHRELQTLISGAEHHIDVDDLRLNTRYGNGFDADHPTVRTFWKVVTEDMDETQRRALLKFVTSCSRQPLLGFKELDPPFCIFNAGSEPDRLPTASTCMNLLKLPDFRDEARLRSKLLYAIESGAGFELS